MMPFRGQAACAFLVITACCVAAAAAPQESPRLRVMIETDAGGDPDDEQSLVRFLLYCNEWDVEGIIATRATAREGENLNRQRTGLGIVRAQLDAYARCRPNLVKHDPRYPAADALRRVTVAGYDGRAGVDLVRAAVDRDDPRPLWFCNWGTDDGSAPSSLKRALDEVLAERGPEGYATFKRRLRLSSDDKFGDHTARLDPPFPIWVDTVRPELNGRRWYHRFSALTATAGGFDVKRDVLTGHGPLGALYPTNTTHPQKEGDTMTFLYLVPTGMNDPDRPGWGSWAGRYGPNEKFPGKPYFWANQPDAWNGTTSRDNTLARWAEHLQNDFRARLDWCVRDRGAANHPPAVRVAGERFRPTRAGAEVVLDASASTDPDGDRLRFEWAVYPEAGTYRGDPVVLERAATPTARFKAPGPGASGEIHIVLSVTDEGSPPLTRYGRVVVKTGDGG
jgi:hypothetical protein